MTGLVLSFQLAAFSVQLLSADADADTAAAVAVGLASAVAPPVEVPESVEAASPSPLAKAGPQPPGGQIEWVPTCDQHGCRLAPRVVPPDTSGATARASQDAAAASSSADTASSLCCKGARRQGNRLVFGRRLLRGSP